MLRIDPELRRTQLGLDLSSILTLSQYLYENHSGNHAQRSHSKSSHQFSVSSLTCPQKFAPLTNIDGSVYGIAAEPFLPSAFQHAKVPTAYPPQSARKAALSPLGLALTWPADRDEEYANALRQAADKIKEVALQEGRTFKHAAHYPNYAIFGTKPEDLYSENLEKLHWLQKRVAPKNVAEKKICACRRVYVTPLRCFNV